jgi:pimeloyl-ACP methyl ester carboxylesterase
MTEKFIEHKDVTLWTEAFGNSSHPVVILIPGAAAQGVQWSKVFCEMLSEKGYYIIRFDPRDTGLSTHIDFSKNPYKMSEMAEDVLAIMDGYNVDKAHIVGTSMGGYIAQILSIDHPERVQTVTLFMSTMDFTSQVYSFMGISTALLSLPGTNPEALNELKNLFAGTDLNNRDEWMNKGLETVRIFNGKKAPFDKEEWLEQLELVYSRMDTTRPIPVPHNHALASGFGPTRFEVDKITCPTLIIHGANDPIIPVMHAHATAAAITNAEKFIIDDMGHARPKTYNKIITDRLSAFWGR